MAWYTRAWQIVRKAVAVLVVLEDADIVHVRETDKIKDATDGLDKVIKEKETK